MARIKLSVEIEIEAENTVFQAAALQTPVQIGEGADFTAPFEAATDPVKAGFLLIAGIQHNLVDKMPEAKEVVLVSQNVETIGH